MDYHQCSKKQYVDNKIPNLSLSLPWQNVASGLYISLSVDMPRLKRGIGILKSKNMSVTMTQIRLFT